ncbi:MAG: hypothetical protein QW464_04225 [Ignisphaera sp.]
MNYQDIVSDSLSILLRYASKLGIPPESAYVAKAMRMLRDKGVSLTHLLAEILLCKYLVEKGFSCDIESTVGDMKCDVYAKKDSVDICIEIMYYTLPLDSIGEWSKSIISSHIRKIIKISRNRIAFAAFAYPIGLVPMIPSEVIDSPTKDAVNRILTKYGLYDEVPNVKDLDFISPIYKIYLFDLHTREVYELLPTATKNLLLFYESITGFSI